MFVGARCPVSKTHTKNRKKQVKFNGCSATLGQQCVLSGSHYVERQKHWGGRGEEGELTGGRRFGSCVLSLCKLMGNESLFVSGMIGLHIRIRKGDSDVWSCFVTWLFINQPPHIWLSFSELIYLENCTSILLRVDTTERSVHSGITGDFDFFLVGFTCEGLVFIFRRSLSVNISNKSEWLYRLHTLIQFFLKFDTVKIQVKIFFSVLFPVSIYLLARICFFCLH